jgi:hypothetical protein
MGRPRPPPQRRISLDRLSDSFLFDHEKERNSLSVQKERLSRRIHFTNEFVSLFFLDTFLKRQTTGLSEDLLFNLWN